MILVEKAFRVKVLTGLPVILYMSLPTMKATDAHGNVLRNLGLNHLSIYSYNMKETVKSACNERFEQELRMSDLGTI